MNNTAGTTAIDNRTDYTPYILAGAALLLRWIHLAFIWSSELVRTPIIDSGFYHQWASQIANGKFVGEGVFFMSPLYPYLLGLIYSIFGVNQGIALILQGVLGAATVLLIYRWVDRRLGRRVAIIASIIAAIYPPFIFYDGVLLTASVILFLSAAILNLADLALEKPSMPNLFMLGAAIGLSALARPLALLIIPIIWIAFFYKEQKTSARRIGLTVAATAVILFAVGLRNLIVGGEFTLTTSSAGMNFYVGNNENATGLYWEAPFLTSVEPQYEDEDYRRVASEAVERNLTTREAGRYWFRRSLDWMIKEPVDWLKLLGKKVFYFWNRAEFANNVSIYLGKDLSPLLGLNPIGFWIIAPFGLAGLFLLWRRRGRGEAFLPVGWVAAYFAGGLIFFVSSEYRLPVVLPLILGSAFLLDLLWTDLRNRKIEPALKLAVLPLIALPIVNFRTDFIVKGENARMDWFNIANTLVRQERTTEAIPCFEKSLAIDPYFAEAMLRLAESYYRVGRVDDAIAIGKRAGLTDPQAILKLVQGSALKEAYALLEEGNLTQAMREFNVAGYDSGAAAAETTRVSHLNEARKAFEMGDIPKSLNHFHSIIADGKETEPAIFYNIAFLSYQLGRLDSATTFAKKALALDSMNVPAGSLLARIYNQTGRPEEGEALTRKLNPDAEELVQMLGAIREDMDSLEAIGEYDQALATYVPYGRLTFDVAPEDKWRLGRLQYRVGNYEVALRLFSEAEAANVVDSGIPLYQGLTLAATGQMTEAEISFQRAIAADPDRVEARMGLARIYLAKGQVDKAFKELDRVSHLEFLNETTANEYRALLDTVKARM